MSNEPPTWDKPVEGVMTPEERSKLPRVIEITGYEIREAIRRCELQRTTLINMFDDLLMAFPGEKKLSPIAHALQLAEQDMHLAALRELQAKYNLITGVELDGVEVTLSYLLSLVRAIGMREGMWRRLVSKKRDRYDRAATERNKESEYSIPTYTPEEACKIAGQISADASTVRSAIALANSRKQKLVAMATILKEGKPTAEGEPTFVLK